MSSTNKTANYELSQFVGTDIPSILNDYNGDMRKIDTAIKAVANAEGSSASDIAGLQATVGQHTTEISGLSSTVNSLSGRVIGIEGKIPANASESNKLITNKDIEDIEAVIPASASAQNKLVTANEIPAQHRVLWSSTDSTKTFRQALNEIFNTILKPLIENSDFATLFSIKIYVPNILTTPIFYAGVPTTLTPTYGGIWSGRDEFIRASGTSEGINISEVRFEFAPSTSSAETQDDRMTTNEIIIGTESDLTNTNIPSNGFYVIV